MEKARIKKDSVVSFLFFSEKIPVSYYNSDYYACLFNKCEADIKKSKLLGKVKLKISDLKLDTDSHIDSCLKFTGMDWFVVNDSILDNCSTYYLYKELKIKDSAFTAFNAFLMHYKSSLLEAAEKNKIVLKEYELAMLRLNKEHRRLVAQKTNILVDKNLEYEFDGESLGKIKYSVPVKEFNTTAFNDNLNTIYFELYQYNSLINGSMPYSKCFGSNNSCTGNNCSQIKVITPADSDVLVTIKKDGNVFRHAYVRSGSTFVFELPNGVYQPYFYYGTGWNPHKYMKKADCGVINGGFLNSESFGKDAPQDLVNQILTYELILQKSGNFSTKPSTMEEAI